MSLMNEALRKKRRTDTQADAPAPEGRDVLAPRKPARNRVVVAAVGCLLAAVGGYFIWQYVSLQDSFQTAVVTTPGPSRQQTPVKIRPSTDPVAGTDVSRETHTPPEKAAAEPDKAPASPAAEKPPGRKTRAGLGEEPQAGPRSGPNAGYRSGLTRGTDPKIEPPVGPATKKSRPVTGPNRRGTRDRKVAAPAAKPQKKAPVRKQPKPTPAASRKKAGFPDRLAKLSPAEMRFYQKALSFHRKQKYHKAIEMYWKVLDKKPMHMDSRFNLASAYIKVSAYSEARPILASLYKHNPEDPATVLNLAIAQIGMDEAANALILLEQAEALASPPIFQIYYHRGVAYSKLGDYEAALHWYRKAERLNPENASLLLNTAVAYDNLARYREAVAFYELYREKAGATSKTEAEGVSMRIRDLRRYLGWKSSTEDR